MIVCWQMELQINHSEFWGFISFRLIVWWKSIFCWNESELNNSWRYLSITSLTSDRISRNELISSVRYSSVSFGSESTISVRASFDAKFFSFSIDPIFELFCCFFIEQISRNDRFLWTLIIETKLTWQQIEQHKRNQDLQINVQTFHWWAENCWVKSLRKM